MFISVVIFGLIILVRQSAALVTVSLFVRCLFFFLGFWVFSVMDVYQYYALKYIIILKAYTCMIKAIYLHLTLLLFSKFTIIVPRVPYNI